VKIQIDVIPFDIHFSKIPDAPVYGSRRHLFLKRVGIPTRTSQDKAVESANLSSHEFFQVIRDDHGSDDAALHNMYKLRFVVQYS
jgi:hypothetical protein